MVTCFALILAASATAQIPRAVDEASKPERKSVQVLESIAVLVRPVLDEQVQILSGKGGDQRKLSGLIYDLTKKQGSITDEALVVLMCFYVGESQEETDAVIARGKKMLPLLKKYQDKNPSITGRTYPDSMLKGSSSKADTFEGAIKAINHGWHSTADNPEG